MTVEVFGCKISPVAELLYVHMQDGVPLVLVPLPHLFHESAESRAKECFQDKRKYQVQR